MYYLGVEFFFIFEKKGQPDQSLLRRLDKQKEEGMTVLIKDQILDHKRDSLEYRLFLC